MSHRYPKRHLIDAPAVGESEAADRAMDEWEDRRAREESAGWVKTQFAHSPDRRRANENK